MTVCYFGIYEPNFSRNRIYISGLREQGIAVLECRDTSKWFLKYWRLWQKHRALPTYDVLIVGYPGHLVVPFAKLLSRKPVIADLLGSLSDAETYSHNPSFWSRVKNRIIDWLAVHFADSILLESQAQKQFFEQRFGISKKYHVLYTGADDSIFHCEQTAQQKPSFTVLFRGNLTLESGILYILEAARLLKSKRDIRFRIIGQGKLLRRVENYIADNHLSNVEIIAQFLSEEELREKMCDTSLSLGQFADNPRLSRTIPHKAFESLSMGIPYLSGDAPAIREIVEEGVSGFLVPLASATTLAQKIGVLYKEKVLCMRVGENGRSVFEQSFSPNALGASLTQLINQILLTK